VADCGLASESDLAQVGGEVLLCVGGFDVVEVTGGLYTRIVTSHNHGVPDQPEQLAPLKRQRVV